MWGLWEKTEELGLVWMFKTVLLQKLTLTLRTKVPSVVVNKERKTIQEK